MPIKTLLVDDERSLLEQAEIFLERIDEEIDIVPVSSAEKALDVIAQENFDVIVSDYQMPEIDGLEFLEKIRKERDSDIPFIMFTGKGREEVAMRALNLGADRYLQKGGDSKSQYGVLADAIEQEIKQGSTEEVLELTKYSVDKATPEIYWITEEGKFTYVNETVVERLGYSKEELEGMYIWDVDPNHGKDIRGERWEKLKEKGTLKFESEHETKEGERYPVEVINHYIKHDDEEYEFAFVRDITERKEAERHYRSVVETSPETIAITDLEGKIIECNQKAVEILGLPSKDEIIGKNAFELIAPEDRERAAENLEKTLEKGELKNIEYTFLDFEGNEFLGELSTSVIRDSEGSPVSFMAIVRDITDRREAEKRIEENKNKIESLHEISAELQSYDSEEEVYSFAIEAAEDILDFEVCEINVPEDGEMIAIVRSSEFPEEGFGSIPVDNSIAGKTYRENESFLTNEIREIKDANPSFEEFKSGISVPIGEHAVFQAVSSEVDHFDEEDLRMAELLMSHVSEALERVQAKEKEEFLHSLLRHDVGNKNQIVKGYLELMKDHDLPDEVKEFVDKAERTTKDSTQIIEKVRKLREIEEEEEIGEVDLGSVMDKVLSEDKDQLQEKGINIDMEECDYNVRGGPLLKELFSNLVENSIQHSGCDEIRISSKIKEDECVVLVEDDGVGISDEMKGKIFDKGFKKGKSAGNGLGLYMVKEIAEGYGGSMEVKDSDMGGARFEIHLERVQQ